MDSILYYIRQFTGCESADIRLFHTEDTEPPPQPGYDEKQIIGKTGSFNAPTDSGIHPCYDKKYEIHKYLCTAVGLGTLDSSLQYVTRDGSFWTNDITQWLEKFYRVLFLRRPFSHRTKHTSYISYTSLAVIPIKSDAETIGTLVVSDKKKGMFTEEVITFLEIIAGQVGFTVRNKTAFEKLRKALDEINLLRGMLPICAYCKRIRDDKGYWHRVEEYIEEHSNVEFTHGLCPECFEKYYPSFGSEKKTE